MYEAQQDKPRRTVALKVIRPGLASPELLRRFEQESHVLGGLQHPGIAQILRPGRPTAAPAFSRTRDGVHPRPDAHAVRRHAQSRHAPAPWSCSPRSPMPSSTPTPRA